MNELGTDNTKGRLKNMRNFLLYLLIAVVIYYANGGTAGTAYAVEKIAYIDVSRTFDEYQKTIDSEEKLKEKRETGQDQLNSLVEEIKGMRQELDLLSDTAKEEKQTELDEKVRELQKVERDLRDELRRERDAMARDIFAEMKTVIEEYGAKEGYSLILDDKVLLYRDKSLDITDTILNVLNRKYKQ
ncbi:MAG: OmpH family outer membrane protein [Candidatus Omnitrophica bacterium]|nr:OmpH family outer membrane protein [Candidatus Omnitrophota bacterium]